MHVVAGRVPRGLLVSVWLAAGCGLRTDPLDYERPIVDGRGDDPGPARTCDDPGVLPSVSTAVESVLLGSSNLSGSCGDDDGPEAVYAFRSPQAADVTLRFYEPNGPAADLSVRVLQGSCDDADAEVLCMRDVADDDDDDDDDDDARAPYFYARAGEDYFIVVDSAEPTAEPLGYAFDLDLEPPDIDACPIHGTSLVQVPGSLFEWGHRFSSGRGRVDGRCGGAGREHMFRIDVSGAGTMGAMVWGEAGFVPVLNVRSGCGGTTEYACSNGSRREPFAELWFEFPGAGTYYLVVDNVTDEGGVYVLQVQFF